MGKGLEFDPGFAPHILAFTGTVEYIYADINHFKNFSQRKIKFRQYHNKLLTVLYNNIGFYAGCIMWAAYIKTQETQDILNNHCLGAKYDENENTSEVDYMKKFVELFPKDMQYFMGEKFEFDPKIIEILDAYREFLIVNTGFVSTKQNTDIQLPQNIKSEGADKYKQIIDEVISSKDLSKFLEYKDMIIK